MKIQVVNAYFKLSDQDLAPKILCQSDKDHGRLFARVSDGHFVMDEFEYTHIELYCIYCEYKKELGSSMYDKMYNIVWMYRFGEADENE